MSQYTTADSEGLQTMTDHDAPERLYQHTTPPQAQQTYGETQKDDNGNPYPYAQGNKVVAAETPSRTILGMRPTTLILLLLFLAASAAAIIAGAVLGSRKTSSCSSPSSTSTPTNHTSPSSSSNSSSNATTTAAGPFVAPTGITVALDCPAINAQVVKPYYVPTSTSFSYQITCGQDCSAHDIVTTWAYSLDMCVDACVSFTLNNYTGIQCGAVAFRGDMGNVTQLGGNCFLKQGGCEEVTQTTDIAHAVLLTLP